MNKVLRIFVYVVIWCLLAVFIVRSVGTLPTRAEWVALFAQGGGPALMVFGAFFSLALVLRTYRFGYLIRKMTDIAWSRIALAFPWLFMAGAVTPFRMGEIVRAEWVRRNGGSGQHTLGLWVAERATDMLILISLGLIGLALAPGMSSLRVPLIVFAVFVVNTYLILSFGQDFLRRSVGKMPVGRHFAAAVLDGVSYMRRPREHATVFGVSLLIWCVMTCAFWSGLTLALGQAVPLSMAVLCMTAVNLAAILSASPGNIGSFQAAGIAVLSQYGIEARVALMTTTTLQVSGLGVTLLLGTTCWGVSLFRRRAAG